MPDCSAGTAMRKRAMALLVTAAALQSRLARADDARPWSHGGWRVGSRLGLGGARGQYTDLGPWMPVTVEAGYDPVPIVFFGASAKWGPMECAEPVGATCFGTNFQTGFLMLLYTRAPEEGSAGWFGIGLLSMGARVECGLW